MSDKIDYSILNGKRTYGFPNKNELINFCINKKTVLVAINAEKILRNSEKLNRIINRHIGYTDGHGAVLALRRKRVHCVKIPGVELWIDIIRQYYSEKTFYFIGAKEEIIETCIGRLKNQFPGINIKGYRNGYILPSDMESLQKEIKQAKPDIVVVGMGSPRQEYFMEDLFNIMPALYIGIGGGFDIYSSAKKRAPEIFQKMYLEWLYRLIKEPRRITRQWVLVKYFYQLCTKGF